MRLNKQVFTYNFIASSLALFTIAVAILVTFGVGPTVSSSAENVNETWVSSPELIVASSENVLEGEILTRALNVPGALLSSDRKAVVAGANNEAVLTDLGLTITTVGTKVASGWLVGGLLLLLSCAGAWVVTKSIKRVSLLAVLTALGVSAASLYLLPNVAALAGLISVLCVTASIEKSWFVTTFIFGSSILVTVIGLGGQIPLLIVAGLSVSAGIGVLSVVSWKNRNIEKVEKVEKVENDREYSWYKESVTGGLILVGVCIVFVGGLFTNLLGPTYGSVSVSGGKTLSELGLPAGLTDPILVKVPASESVGMKRVMEQTEGVSSVTVLGGVGDDTGTTFVTLAAATAQNAETVNARTAAASIAKEVSAVTDRGETVGVSVDVNENVKQLTIATVLLLLAGGVAGLIWGVRRRDNWGWLTPVGVGSSGILGYLLGSSIVMIGVTSVVPVVSLGLVGAAGGLLGYVNADRAKMLAKVWLVWVGLGMIMAAALLGFVSFIVVVLAFVAAFVLGMVVNGWWVRLLEHMRTVDDVIGQRVVKVKRSRKGRVRNVGAGRS